MRTAFFTPTSLFIALLVSSSPAVSADNALVIGPNVTSPNPNSVNLGVSNSIGAPGAVAVGSNNTASANDSVAIGSSSTASGTNSVAIGSGSQANEADTVSVGSASVQRRVVNVAAGVAPTDAVNVGQMQAEDDVLQGQITTNTGSIAAVEATNSVQSAQIGDLQTGNALQASQISDLQSGVAELFDLRREDRRDMRQGIAVSVAMSTAPMPSAPGRLSYSVNAATFRGQHAVGGSMMYRLNTASMMAIGGGFSYAGNKNHAARVGLAGEF